MEKIKEVLAGRLRRHRERCSSSRNRPAIARPDDRRQIRIVGGNTRLQDAGPFTVRHHDAAGKLAAQPCTGTVVDRDAAAAVSELAGEICYIAQRSSPQRACLEVES